MIFCSSFFIEVRTDPMNSMMEIILMILSLLFCASVYEFLFWFIHRLLHTSYLYKHIHYVHHELRTTVGIGGIYVHPLEFVFVNFLPGFISAYAFKHNIISLCILMALSGGGAITTHSGYTGTHVIHHWTKHCYFSIFGVMDRLMGTYIS